MLHILVKFRPNLAKIHEDRTKTASQLINELNCRFVFFCFRKRCVAIEPRFDFLKELVADVPDLLGEFDADRDSAPPVEFHAGRVVPKGRIV